MISGENGGVENSQCPEALVLRTWRDWRSYIDDFFFQGAFDNNVLNHIYITRIYKSTSRDSQILKWDIISGNSNARKLQHESPEILKLLDGQLFPAKKNVGLKNSQCLEA